MSLVITSVELGLLYGLVALGVYITFTLLRFPDLTVDMSLVTGAAVGAIAVRAGVPGLLALGLSMTGGLVAGSLTAFLHTHLKVGKILSGILALGLLYSLNLRIMGSANLSLLHAEHVISWLKSPLRDGLVLLLFFIILLGVKLLIDWFLKTRFGLALRATGENEATAKALGINTKSTKFVGVALSNGIVGLAGGLLAQFQGFIDIQTGAGTIILGLAAILLGFALVQPKSIFVMTSVVVAGSIVYQFIVNIALRLGLAGTDLKFFSAMIVVIALVLSRKKSILQWQKSF